MVYGHPDDEGFTYSTDREWDNAAARELGELYPDRAWVSTGRDVWHKNPFYTGPAVRHPEDDDYEEDAEMIALHKADRMLNDPAADFPF